MREARTNEGHFGESAVEHVGRDGHRPGTVSGGGLPVLSIDRCSECIQRGLEYTSYRQ
jgi:hypothetical protein